MGQQKSDNNNRMIQLAGVLVDCWGRMGKQYLITIGDYL